MWVNAQRTGYRLKQLGQKSAMSEERIQKLNYIGFVWNRKKTWDRRFNELQEYKKLHGTCNVRQSEESGLGRWVNTLRTKYRRKQLGQKSTMTEERIQKLNDIGFVWNMKTAELGAKIQ
jgi:hypothetical protein